MNAFVGVDELTPQKLNGIIADLLVDFTNVGASAPGGGDAGDSLFSLVRTLADTKTLACGKNYRSFRAEDPYKRKNYPVEQRAALVPKQYLSKARSLDQQLHGTPRGTVGPIEAKLLEYGALDGPDAHAVVGLVLGAFGELSTSCYSLCTSIARVAAHVSRTRKLSCISDLSSFELWVGTVQSTRGVGGCGSETFASATCSLQLAKASAATLSKNKAPVATGRERLGRCTAGRS